MNATHTLRGPETMPLAAARRLPEIVFAPPDLPGRRPGSAYPLLASCGCGLLVIVAISSFAAQPGAAAVVAAVVLLLAATRTTAAAASAPLRGRAGEYAGNLPTPPCPSSRSPPDVTIALLGHRDQRAPADLRA